jgi:hypothetical protein
VACCRTKRQEMVLCSTIYLILMLTACSEVETKWMRRFDALGPGNYRINSIGCSKEDIFLTGTYTGENNNAVCFLARYNKAGSLVWHQVYEMPGNTKTSGEEILITRTQVELLTTRVDIYVLAEAQDSDGTHNAIIIKYDTLGNAAWERTVTSNKGPLMCTLLSDFEGKLYVAGWEEDSGGKRTISIAKFHESGETEWSTKYYTKELDYDDLKFDIMEPTIFVLAGLLKNTNELFYMKYSSSGQFQGMIKYEPEAEVQAISGLRITPDGTIFVIANVSNAETGIDFLTAAFDSKDSLLWAHEYDGEAHLDDYSEALSVDEAMNVYVAGSTEYPGRIPNIVTVKYDKSGNRLWDQSLRQNKAAQPVIMEPKYMQLERTRPYLSYLYIAGTTGDDALILRSNTNGVYSFQALYGRRGSVTMPTALADRCLALQRTRDNRSEALVTKFGPSTILGIARWD